MYWDHVLSEVLQKTNPFQSFAFTNIQEYLPQPPVVIKEKKIPRKKPSRSWQKFLLGKRYPNVYFTLREVQTIHCLLRGKTVIEAADLLNLSRRTIEFYLKNMKSKLNCRYKSELITEVLNSDLVDLLQAELF